jgi:hypothetical protein
LLASLLALALAAQPAPQPALTLGYLEARDLLARCTVSSGQDYCFGYIAAVYDSIRAYESWLSLKEVCVPAGTPQGELKMAVVEHFRANPDSLTNSAASVVVIALAKRFPCSGAARR